MGLGLLATLFLCTLLPGRISSTKAAEPGWSVSVTPTKVVDGQPVAINVKAAPGFTVSEARVGICRAGVTYQVGTDEPNADFVGDGPNCPGQPISSSATPGQLTDPSTVLNAGKPDGETFLYRVGAGTVEWLFPLGSGAKVSLTCGVDDPCVLVVEGLVGEDARPGSSRWEPFVQPLTYASDDPFAGCGGPADGVLNTGGSDRMFDTWVSWTVAECKLPGRRGSAGRASFIGEGDAVKNFNLSAVDLAYSAGGYDEGMGLVTADSARPNGGLRAEVNVPVGLNATVLAVGGGRPVSGHVVPYRDVKLTVAEVAGILRGATQGEQPYDEAIRARNPDFNPVFDATFGDGVGGSAAAVAIPGPDANSWYMTRMLTTLVPDAWKVPDVSVFGTAAGKTRGIDNALALADPTFAQSIALLSGRPPVLKILATHNSNTPGGFWMLTDLQTANAFGLTPVQIETVPGSGDFVGPTPETMTAAVPTMVRDKHGILIGDPKAVAAPGQPAVYPLTYVEYAIAPAEPLLNEDCTRRTASQALLNRWLQYITGPGQDALAPGMLPLTADLRAEAAKAIPLVGARAVTGDCKDAGQASAPAAATPAPPSASTGPAASSHTGGDAGTSGGDGFQPSATPAPADSAPAATAPVTTPPASAPLAPTILLPAFAGNAPLKYGGTVLALLGILALSALAASGRTASGLAWRRRLAARWRPGGAGPRGPDAG